ncbi:MAG: VanZ family protein [Bacteroidota bacterium]
MNQQSKIVSFFQFQLPALAWSIFIFAVSSIPSGRIPALIDYTDKVLHAGVFGVLCWLIHIALFFQPNVKLKKHSALIALLLTMFYGIIDEYHQMYTPGRTTEFWDFLADTTGGGVYLLLNTYFRFYIMNEDVTESS